MADKTQWFRVSTRITDSKKIHDLTDAHFRWLILFWAEARKNDGIIPPMDELSFHLRRPKSKIENAIASLQEFGFIDLIDGHLVPHDWDEWQREETKSTERVQRFRERHRNGHETIGETPNETHVKRDETAPRARVRTEQNRGEEQNRGNETFHLDLACATFTAEYPVSMAKSPGFIERWYAENVGKSLNPAKLHSEIMAGLLKAKASWEWEKQDGKFICAAMKFLEGKRWLEPWTTNGNYETPLTRLEDLD